VIGVDYASLVMSASSKDVASLCFTTDLLVQYYFSLSGPSSVAH